MVAELAKKKPAPKSSKLVFTTPETPAVMDGIEVFTLVEEDEEEQTEEFDV